MFGCVVGRLLWISGGVQRKTDSPSASSRFWEISAPDGSDGSVLRHFWRSAPIAPNRREIGPRTDPSAPTDLSTKILPTHSQAIPIRTNFSGQDLELALSHKARGNFIAVNSFHKKFWQSLSDYLRPDLDLKFNFTNWPWNKREPRAVLSSPVCASTSWFLVWMVRFQLL